MILKHKIDFLMVIVVEGCNPNGDPTTGMPRQDIDGYGEISDVCLKRKIRNRMQDLGHEILIKTDERSDDGHKSIMARVKGNKKLWSEILEGMNEDAVKTACDSWIDVRAFGQLIPRRKGEGVSIGIRGPVTIGGAKSVDTIIIETRDIVKSINLIDIEGGGKDSSTIGRQYAVQKGVYVAKGSIFPALAKMTGFTEEDTKLLKECILTMFENDATARRPSGSMWLDRLYWWESEGELSRYAAAKIFHSLEFQPAEEYPYYKVTEKPLEGLKAEVYK